MDVGATGRSPPADPASAGMFIIIKGSPLATKAGPKGEAGGGRRRAVEVLAGPDPWNKQGTGLAGVAFEAKTHRLRSEALP